VTSKQQLAIAYIEGFTLQNDGNLTRLQ